MNADDDSKRVGYYIAYGENSQELDKIMFQIKDVFQIILEKDEDTEEDDPLPPI